MRQQGILCVVFSERMLQAHTVQSAPQRMGTVELIGLPTRSGWCGGTPAAMGLRAKTASKGVTTSCMIRMPPL